MRRTIDQGLSDITSRNAEWPPTTVFDEGSKKYLLVPDFAGWGYDLAAKPAPSTFNSRALAELYVHDIVALQQYQTVDTVGTFVLHVLPFGAAADHFSQDGILSGDAWLAVVGDAGAALTFGTTKWARVIGVTATGSVMVVSTYDAAKAIHDGEYAVAAGNLGDIMLRAAFFGKGIKGLKATGPGGRVAGTATVDDLVIDSYGNLRRRVDIPGQAHHLNQTAAYRDVIPTRQGASIKLEGNILTDAGAPHTRAHQSLEAFWNRYRGTEIVPTNLEYTRALQQSLRAAGLPEVQVQQAVRAAIRERVNTGLLGGLEVPRVPRPIRNLAE